MKRAARSKTIATWLALVGGAVGLHRFYLHGWRDGWGWLLPFPTAVGLYGVVRMRQFGADDHLAWVLIPVLGVVLAATMLTAIVYGLTPDLRWNARWNAGAAPGDEAGWLAVIGVVLALVFGAGVLMATLAFGAQRYFEYQAEARVASR